MPVPLLAVAAGAGLVKSGFDYFGAKSAEKKADEELASLKRPFYKVQNEYYQNRNLAQEQAQGGLTATAKDYYTNQTERGLGTGISAIQQTGGSPNDIAKLFDNYENGLFNVAAQDSMLQKQNIGQLMATNKDLAGQKTIQWSLNELQPYENKLKELTQRKGAAQINANNALNSAVGTIGATSTGLQNQKLLDKLFATKKDPNDYLNVDVTKAAPSWLSTYQDPNLQLNG